MEIQDCFWEIENIGQKTVQLNYSIQDKFNKEKVCQAITGYQYIVAKVPCGNVNCLLGLQQNGFHLMETQMHMSKSLIEFNTEISKFEGLTNQTTFKQVVDDVDFNMMTSLVDNEMFSTDRVTLDPYYGPEIGRQRYVGWMRNEYSAKSSFFWWIIYAQTAVGFMMLRQKGKTVDCLLNGLFTEYQGKGLGILTPASPLLLASKGILNFDTEITSISSNNAPVVHLYNKLNFKINEMDYVLVKHNCNFKN